MLPLKSLLLRLKKKSLKESEECPTATTPDESDVVPEVMVPDITAEAGPMTEEVVSKLLSLML